MKSKRLKYKNIKNSLLKMLVLNNLLETLFIYHNKKYPLLNQQLILITVNSLIPVLKHFKLIFKVIKRKKN